MKKFVKYFFLTILIIMYSPTTYAGGSSYSRYGVGDILHYGDSRLYAMGGTGIALLDGGFINGLNPAGLARISFTRFSGGFEYNRFLSKDESGSALYSIGRLQGLAFAFPISKENGVVLSAEATPYSLVSYAINSSIFDSSTGLTRNKTFYGSGGLSYLGLGLSASPSTAFHVGARLNYMYGRTRQYQTSFFDDPSYVAPVFDRSIYYSGFTFTLGTIYEGIGKIINIPFLHDLSIGLIATTPISLDADEQRIYPGAAYYMDDSTVIQHGTADLPLTLGLGFSYLHQDRYRFLSDLVFEKWENTKYFGMRQMELRNSFRTSIGFEAIPFKGADTFWKRIYYRAGFAYNATYYKIHDVGINEFIMSGGVGLPIGPESRLNIGVQVGVRGSIDNKLQKDTIFRLSIAISASELWFQKYEED
jgi:hypothetical protein